MSSWDRSGCLAGMARVGRSLAAALLLHAVISFVGGTLIHCGRPCAVEAGFALQDCTGINELIRWADERGHDGLLAVLLAIGDGVELGA